MGLVITEIDNRLGKHTTDLVLKVEIEGIVAEFQLAMSFNVTENEFSHKIFELLRSKSYSITSTIKIFN